MSFPKITNQGVALTSILLACAMVFGSFWLSRGDHDLKLMSLQAVLTTGGTLLGIAGTLLVGSQAYSRLMHKDIEDLPPGTKQTDSTTVQIPPITSPPMELGPVEVPQQVES